MNYSRNIKKNSIGKRILISWIVIAVMFSLIGGLVGCRIASRRNKAREIKPAAETRQAEKTPVYGTLDGRKIDKEIPLDWKSGDPDFIPLDVPIDLDLQEFIFYLCKGYNIDFALVMGMIQQESAFQTNIISATGDYGLMQINKCNFEYLTENLEITDFIDPYNNVRAALFILRQLFENYDSTSMVLMAYSMGEYGASKLWAQGVFESNYSRIIIANQAEFQRQLMGE